METATWLLAVLAFTEGNIQLQELLRWDSDDRIREAVIEAGRRIGERKACSKLFGADAGDVLKSANYRIVPAGMPQRQAGPGMKYAVVNAMTLREQKLILINSDGAFIKPRMTVFDAHFNYGLRDGVELRSFVLLHELGHLMGTFQPDAHDQALNRKHSESVLKACYR